ncbi:MAG: alpha/beta hydrolase family protein [Armatimonadota bacterium]
MTTFDTRIQTVPVATQDYVSVQYGDARIDTYVTEPAGGVRATTGFMLLIHGWGNDGSTAYAGDSVLFADEFDLVVTRVEFRQCGREAHHPAPGTTYDVPYDFSKLQAIDCLRAAYATLARYPQLDRSRLYLWGGSQGGHLGAQCLIFAPHLWALAVLTCGVYIPMNYERTQAQGFSKDLTTSPGGGFIDCALGPGSAFSEAEEDIRNPYRNAALMPEGVPVILLHGTHDDIVDIKHSVFLYARLLGLRRPVQFYAIEHGDHGLVWATFQDEDSRLKATLKYAGDALHDARRENVTLQPSAPVRIPVRGGVFEVSYPAEGPTLSWMAG